MKQTILTALLGLAFVASPLSAQERGGREGREGAGRQDPPLKQEMEKLDEAVDAVAEFLKKPDGDAPMAEVAAAQAALHEAKKYEPRATQRQPEDKRADYVRDFRIEINKLIRRVLDLEDALLKKDWKGATKVLDEIEKVKKEGHQVYKPRRQRRGGGEGGEGEGRPGGGGRAGGGN